MTTINNTLLTDKDRLDIIKAQPTTINVYNTTNTFLGVFSNPHIVVQSFNDRDNYISSNNPSVIARSSDVFLLGVGQNSILVINNNRFIVNELYDDVKSGFTTMSLQYQ